MIELPELQDNMSLPVSGAQRDECCVMTSSLISERLACCVCHCIASDHAVCSYCYEMIEQQVTRTSDDLRRQLHSTIGGSLGTSYSLKGAIDMRLVEIRHSVIRLIIQAYCCLRHRTKS